MLTTVNTMGSESTQSQQPPKKKTNILIPILIIIIGIIVVLALQIIFYKPIATFLEDNLGLSTSLVANDVVKQSDSKDKKKEKEDTTTKAAITTPSGVEEQSPSIEQGDPPTSASMYNGAPPVFNKVYASSTRSPMSGVYYDAFYAYDGDPTTAWCEGVSGEGIGEWIEFYSDTDQRVNGIRIQNGYMKSSSLYSKNNSISAISIHSLGETYYLDCSKSYDVWQEISFDQPIDSNFFRIEILSVYPGTSDSYDTLISDIEFF